MSVKAEHKDYAAMLPKWNRCIDVCKGQDAIHGAGVAYLPKLTEQTDTEYAAYRDRTPFYGATWRTITGLQGMIFRKPPSVSVPKSIEEMLKDINLSGTPLHIFALEASEECLKLGRVGVFVDFPEVSEGATAADMGVQNLRPSMKLYSAVSIINWKTANIRNQTKLCMVVLRELVDKDGEDEFEVLEQVQYRVLDLVPYLNEAGELLYKYRVRVFEVKSGPGQKDVDVLIEGPFYPMINNKNLEDISFQFIGVDDVSWKVDEPPLIDLVDMNLSHYRTMADYEHGCHFTGLPTAVISGFTPEVAEGEPSSKFCIGSMTAWVFPNASAKATYLEFTGQGLQSLKENAEKKENYMAVLGARMLEAQVRGVESANTAAIHRGGEQSMLSSVAQAISIGIEKCLKVFVEFAGESPEDTKFDLNRDFFPVPMDALTLTAIIAGWQNNAYSYDTMFANLKKGEIIPIGKTVEEEQAELKKNPPPVMDAPTTPGNVKKKSPKAKNTPATPAPTITQMQNKK